MEPITYSNVGTQLVIRVPEFRRQYDQYVSDQSGENLPHVLFASFTPFVQEQFDQMNSNFIAKDTFLRSIEFLEQLLETKDSDLSNLVGVSFLENLHQPHDYYGPLRDMKPYFKKEMLALLFEMMGANV